MKTILTTLRFLAVVITLQLLVATAAQAHLPLLFNGYYAVTNSVFVDPASPGYLQVRTGGGGGASQIGKFSVSSANQRMDFATGLITATYVFVDSDGDKLNGEFSGPAAQQPDGRITFGGSATLGGGTGRYANVSGTLVWDG